MKALRKMLYVPEAEKNIRFRPIILPLSVLSPWISALYLYQKILG